MSSSAMKKRLIGKGLTRFQADVLIVVMSIPKGETRTYKQVAKMAGRPDAYRAVGTALKRNPFAPKIPCHRVVRSDGDIGNYSASGGRSKKAAMLRAEKGIATTCHLP